jgi:tetratricopeptide (TPR) repeat protein
MTDRIQPEAHELRDAAETRRIPTLAAATGARAKQTALLQRALKLADSDAKKALELAQKALAMDDAMPQAHHIVGLLHDKLGVISTALEHYEAAWKLDPEDAEIYQNMGLAAWKLGMLEAAERFFRISRMKEPGRVDSAINLAGVLRDQSRFDDAIEILRQTIFANERNADLWNVLGSVLLESGDPTQAETFYREALSIRPDFGRAWHNLAYALDMHGDLEGALHAYDTALACAAAPSDEATMRHGRAFTLLSAGRLRDGWDEYDVRLKPALTQAVIFAIPAQRWDRDPAKLAGKRVLLVGEQGLGDEVLFLNAAADLVRALGPNGHLLIACAERLIPLVARAFPNATIGAHKTFSAEARKFRTAPWLESVGGCDLWTPMGDPVCVFRRDPADFPQHDGFLKADPVRIAEMRSKLRALGPGLKVGIVWKSMLMTASRAKYFSPFAQWAPVLKTAGVQFVNLQYGAVDAELAQAQSELGVTIHQIEGLDVKDDLDGVAALGAALDVSIGPMTASINLAAAAAGECWVLAYEKHWPGLGSGRMLWYPNARAISPPGWGQWDAAMRQTAALLAERAAAGASKAA